LGTVVHIIPYFNIWGAKFDEGLTLL
jgi:hypothetical protein